MLLVLIARLNERQGLFQINFQTTEGAHFMQLMHLLVAQRNVYTSSKFTKIN